MGLKIASTLATTFLFAMVYALVFIVGIWFLPSDLLGSRYSLCYFNMVSLL
ncbi:MAG: hypothetical protein ACTSPN_13355 [Promethearchaeota archaeon]